MLTKHRSFTCVISLLHLTLTQPVSAGNAPKQQQGASGKPPKLPGAVSLLGCLQRFVRPERLGTAEQWVCGGCSRPQHAVKQMSVHRLPPVLCLHVKRFEHTVRSRCGPEKSSSVPLCSGPMRSKPEYYPLSSLLTGRPIWSGVGWMAAQLCSLQPFSLHHRHMDLVEFPASFAVCSVPLVLTGKEDWYVH